MLQTFFSTSLFSTQFGNKRPLWRVIREKRSVKIILIAPEAVNQTHKASRDLPTNNLSDLFWFISENFFQVLLKNPSDNKGLQRANFGIIQLPKNIIQWHNNTESILNCVKYYWIVTLTGLAHGIMGTGIPNRFTYLWPRLDGQYTTYDHAQMANTLPMTAPGQLIHYLWPNIGQQHT